MCVGIRAYTENRQKVPSLPIIDRNNSPRKFDKLPTVEFHSLDTFLGFFFIENNRKITSFRILNAIRASGTYCTDLTGYSQSSRTVSRTNWRFVPDCQCPTASDVPISKSRPPVPAPGSAGPSRCRYSSRRTANNCCPLFGHTSARTHARAYIHTHTLG